MSKSLFYQLNKTKCFFFNKNKNARFKPFFSTMEGRHEVSEEYFERAKVLCGEYLLDEWTDPEAIEADILPGGFCNFIILCKLKSKDCDGKSQPRKVIGSIFFFLSYWKRCFYRSLCGSSVVRIPCQHFPSLEKRLFTMQSRPPVLGQNYLACLMVDE